MLQQVNKAAAGEQLHLLHSLKMFRHKKCLMFQLQMMEESDSNLFFFFNKKKVWTNKHVSFCEITQGH